MHQHDIRLAFSERFQAGAHRGLAGGAAEDRRQDIDAGGRGLEHRHVVGVNNRLHGADLRMLHERQKAAADHRRATDRPELLGHVGAGAYPASSRHDHCCNARHASSTPDFPLD